MMNAIKNLLEETFSNNGWLANNNYDVNPAQKEYAFSVLGSLKIDGKYNLLEAGTGVGKSFAYALTVLAYAALMKKRVIIATHSIALQNDLLNDTIPMVEKCLIDADIPIPIIEQRIGMQHYVDPMRVAGQLKDVDNRNISLSMEFIQWAKDSSDSGSGLIEDWIYEYGELPFGLTPQDICLNIHSHSDINTSFEKHKLDSKLADVIITSHMMLLSNISNNVLGIFKPGDVVLMDESDTIVDTMETITNKHIRLTKIKQQLKNNYSSLTAKSQEVASSCITDVEQMIEATYVGKAKGYQGFSTPSELTKHLDNIVSLLNRLVTLKIRKKCRDNRETFPLRETIFDSEAILYQLKGYSTLMSMHTSPVRHERSYVVGLYKPAIILKKLINSSVSIICTSATLKDRAGSAYKKASFNNYAIAMGINMAKDVNVATSIEPHKFGQVEYVLADKRAPTPFIKTEGIEYNRSWLKYVMKTIHQACKNGNKLLVLTSSYNEVNALMGFCNEKDRGVFHLKGPLTNCFENFKKTNASFLVTPAGWSGFSFRHNKEQVFSDVMITKVPFLPPNEMAVIRKGLELSGDSVLDKTKLSLAKRYTYNASLEATISKLMQGFGRLIRNKQDSGNIWVTDPRFPHVDSHQYSNLSNAIPLRFKDSYKSHRVAIHNGAIEDNLQANVEQLIGFI